MPDEHIVDFSKEFGFHKESDRKYSSRVLKQKSPRLIILDLNLADAQADQLERDLHCRWSAEPALKQHNAGKGFIRVREPETP